MTSPNDRQRAIETARNIAGNDVRGPLTAYGDGIVNLARAYLSLLEREGALERALVHVREVCADNAPETCNHKMALGFVRQVAVSALTPDPSGSKASAKCSSEDDADEQMDNGRNTGGKSYRTT